MTDDPGMASGAESRAGPSAPLSLRRVRVQVALLILFAGILRFADLGGKSLWVDEARGVHVNQRPLREITERCQASHTAPLREYLLHYLSKAPAGRLEAMTRLPAAVAGILVIPVVFLLGRFLFGQAAGLCAALFLAAHPWQVLHSQDNRMHVVSLLFSALVLFQLCRLLYGRPTWKGWALWGALVSLYAWFTLLSALVFAAVGPLIVVEWIGRMLRRERRAEARRLLAGAALAALVALVLYAPWLGTLLKVAERYQEPGAQEVQDVGAQQAATPPPGEVRPAADGTAPAPLPPPVLPGPVNPYATHINTAYFRDMYFKLGGDQPLAAAMSLLLAVAGAVSMAKGHRGKLWIVLFWFLSPLPILGFSEVGHFFPPRYVLYFLTVYALLVGLGLSTLFGFLAGVLPGPEGRRNALAAALVGVFLAGPLVAGHGAGLARYYRGEKQDWRGAMAFLAEAGQPDDKIIVGDLWAGYSVWVYRAPCLRKGMRFVTNALSLGAFYEEVEKDKNVWYVYWADRPAYIQRIADDRMQEVRVFEGLLGNVRVMRKKTYVDYSAPAPPNETGGADK